jgi:hypothetical protein
MKEVEFKTQKSFNEYVKKNILTPLIRDLADEIHKELYKYIEREWYENNAGYSSKSLRRGGSLNYFRTYSFLKSLIKTEVKYKGSDFSFKIHFDYNKMVVSPPWITSSGLVLNFGSRTSINNDTSYEGSSISRWLVQWIEEGQNSPIHSYSGIGMFEHMEDTLKQDLNSRVLAILNRYGVTAQKG